MTINIPEIDFGTIIYSYDPTDGYENFQIVKCVNYIMLNNQNDVWLCADICDGEICKLSIFEQEIPYDIDTGLYFFIDKNKFMEFKTYTKNINESVTKNKYDQFFKKENKDDYFEKNYNFETGM